MVIHTCDPSHSGQRQEDCNSRPARQSAGPNLKNKLNAKGLGVAQVVECKALSLTPNATKL
jgi:hypothetical protein